MAYCIVLFKFAYDKVTVLEGFNCNFVWENECKKWEKIKTSSGGFSEFTL